eukprot:CAMPEP_0185777124 /NCGR_PEP_ID=MMETSP1174-20130828/88374_1 /TAXON_ID=35687 /ORGANISM="Dictyocha speculum, Strain CCMP1381" /LENGTH=239 /DNA_ID=CAMNT_0028465395 /DNA_START=28 /DNA_END=747 /DNA_ORIENTATION=-
MTSSPEYDGVNAPSNISERDGLCGVVRMFDSQRKFGFITLSQADGGGEVFLHIKEVRGGRCPTVGESLEFDVRARGEGCLRAVDVTAVGVRSKRALALYADEARAQRLKRGAGTLNTTFAAGSVSQAKVEDSLRLPAGLTSAADLRAKARIRMTEEAVEAKAAGDEETRRLKERNRSAAAALRGGINVGNIGTGGNAADFGESAVGELPSAAKNAEKRARKRAKKKQAAKLSFDVDDGA